MQEGKSNEIDLRYSTPNQGTYNDLIDELNRKSNQPQPTQPPKYIELDEAALLRAEGLTEDQIQARIRYNAAMREQAEKAKALGLSVFEMVQQQIASVRKEEDEMRAKLSRSDYNKWASLNAEQRKDIAQAGTPGQITRLLAKQPKQAKQSEQAQPKAPAARRKPIKQQEALEVPEELADPKEKLKPLNQLTSDEIEIVLDEVRAHLAKGQDLARLRAIDSTQTYTAAFLWGKQCIEAIASGIDGKHCPSCGHAVPVTYFHRDRSRKDGFSIYCRRCNQIRARNHYEERKRKDAIRFACVDPDGINQY